MGDPNCHNRVDLYLQLLLELVCCFFVDLYGENAISGFSKAFDGSYVLLLRGSILWLVTEDKSVVLLSLEHFTEDLYRHCIDNLSLQFFLGAADSCALFILRVSTLLLVKHYQSYLLLYLEQ